LSRGEVYIIQIPVCLEVLLENAVIFYPSVFIIYKTVKQEIGDHTVAFVFGEILTGKKEVDMVGFLAGISSRGIHDPEIETEIKAAVDIPAEFHVEEELFFCTLNILKL
jgi:hypothetical protein